MPIVGDKPTRGIRLHLKLHGQHYEGTATTPSHQWELRAEVAEDGEVTMQTSAPGEVAEYVRRVVRIAVRDAKKDKLPLPRFLQRWRDRDPGC
jgi:hypothetical protein